MNLKDFVRPLVPRALVDFHRKRATDRIEAGFAGLSSAEIFGTIYSRKLWGGADVDYSSGTGSNDDAVVAPYIDAVRAFLTGFPAKPDAVDLGCGDFNVGSRVRDMCARYIACDVVAELIERNARRFPSLDVTFRHLDVASDELPVGEVAFLRQVLQHLSNEQISRITPRLPQYRWLVLTEHLPLRADFVPNHDKPTGPGVRLRFGSGVVLSAPPFNLRPIESRVLCSTTGPSDVIQTIAYRLADDDDPLV